MQRSDRSSVFRYSTDVIDGFNLGDPKEDGPSGRGDEVVGDCLEIWSVMSVLTSGNGLPRVLVPQILVHSSHPDHSGIERMSIRAEPAITHRRMSMQPLGWGV